jgi:hypothetical protein
MDKVALEPVNTVKLNKPLQQNASSDMLRNAKAE